ncbi:MAG: ribosome biogenesis GTPase Der [Myxococcales bacterium]|nr:ribosome biogenesis GTPase Der [Myxococcales bacterium]
MRALVAIVGRPNVGKSTLFNRLVGAKKAIVLDTPGVTRDRHYGEAKWAGPPFDLIDTGGFEMVDSSSIVTQMREQAMAAIEESDLVIFVVDGRAGVTPDDIEVARLLRNSSKACICAVNKIDGQKQDDLIYEFYSLGLENILPISAEHSRGVSQLLEAVDDTLHLSAFFSDLDGEREDETRIALLGRPNVGKSTLTNRLLGEDRMIVDSTAGTTRDSIDAPLIVDDERFLLIDTAGLRRKSNIKRWSSEGFSVMRTIRAIERCHVAVVLIDAEEGITDQDAKIIGLTHEKGRALIILVNKWDAVEKDHKTVEVYKEQIDRKLPFAGYAPILFISGLTGQRVHKLIGFVKKVRENHLFRSSTGPLNRWLEEVVQKHHPPTHKNRRLRLYYVTQARNAPPTLIFHCNHPEAVHFSYQRYLVNQFREKFGLEGTPIRLIFRGKDNPFAPEEI